MNKPPFHFDAAKVDLPDRTLMASLPNNGGAMIDVAQIKAEVASLLQAEKDRAEMLALLRGLRRLPHSRRCPVCSATEFDEFGKRQACAPGCKLAALLARFPEKT